MGAVADFLSDNAGDLIKAGVQLFTTAQNNSANREAARDTAALSEDAAGILKGGYDAQLAELLSGSDAVSQLYGKGFDATTAWMTDNADRYAGAINEAMGAYGTGQTNTATAFGNGMWAADNRFAGEMGGNAANYTGALQSIGNTLTSDARAYGSNLTGVGNQYSDEMGIGLDQYGNVIQGGYGAGIGALGNAADQFQQQYQPYQQAGGEALNQLRQTMATDPSQWTPAQQRLIEQYRRGAGAKLAASGLRGAGRAGIAAINEGEAALMAQLYGQNQQRSDAATNLLMNTGYGAAGNVAGNMERLGNSTANLITGATDKLGSAGLSSAQTTALARARLAEQGLAAQLTAQKAAADLAQKGAASQFENANLAAGNSMKTGAAINQNQYSTAADIAARNLSAQTDTASKTAQTGNSIADQISRYYGNLTSLAGQDATATANTAMNKAMTDAGAKTAGGQALIQAGLNNTQNWGTSLGALSSIIAANQKDATARQSSYFPITWNTTQRSDGTTGDKVTWGSYNDR